MRFEWNPHKEKVNRKKHGITFEEAAYVFSDPFALSKHDREHADDEERWILLGKILRGIVVVVHTFRKSDGVEYVRIISARMATKREQRAYQDRVPE